MNIGDSERLAIIETTVLDIKTRLFGRDEDRGIVGNFNHRLTKLENWRWWVVGIAVGLGVALGGVGQKLIAAVLK